MGGGDKRAIMGHMKHYYTQSICADQLAQGYGGTQQGKTEKIINFDATKGMYL